MRKNINKIIAVAIGVSVMSGSIIPAFAADSTTSSSTTTVTSTTGTTTISNTSTANAQSNVLTLDDAVKAAISISNTLALDEQKIAYQDKENDISKKQDDYTDVSDNKETYDDDTSSTTLDQLKQQRDFDEDSLTQKVTDQYSGIVTSQMKIDMASKSLDIEKKKLNDAKLKQSLGIETSIDIQSSELTIQKDQNSLTTSQNQLKDTEYTFKLLTGKDVTQYNLEKDIKFEPLKIDGSLDDYLDNVVESDLKYSEELLKISKDYYDKDYESDNSITSSDIDNAKTAADSATKPTAPSASDLQADPTAYEKYQDQLTSYTNTKSKYTNLLTARLSYLKVKLSNYSNDVSIQETKKQLKEALRSYYTNLQTYEDSINYYKKEIDLYNAQLSNYKLKYDLGMMTESDYNTQVVSTLQAEIDLRNAIVSYNQNKEYIQKPWIASSSK
jgi:hypothetical protein